MCNTVILSRWCCSNLTDAKYKCSPTCELTFTDTGTFLPNVCSYKKWQRWAVWAQREHCNIKRCTLQTLQDLHDWFGLAGLYYDPGSTWLVICTWLIPPGIEWIHSCAVTHRQLVTRVGMVLVDNNNKPVRQSPKYFSTLSRSQRKTVRSEDLFVFSEWERKDRMKGLFWVH